MKKVVILFAVCGMLISCGNDDECTAEMVSGTYMGVIECSSQSDEEQITLTVSGTGNQITITDQDGQDYNLELRGCKFNVTPFMLDIFGLIIDVSGDGEFDGERLIFELTSSAAGIEETCRFTANRQ